MSTDSAYRLPFKYAVLQEGSTECVNVCTAARAINDPTYIEIDTLNFDYIGKHYINGAWYEDAAGTIPWSPEA